jgi:hypothetical protein
VSLRLNNNNGKKNYFKYTEIKYVVSNLRGYVVGELRGYVVGVASLKHQQRQEVNMLLSI